MVPSSIFELHPSNLCFHHHNTFSSAVPNLPLPSSYKDPCDYIGPTQTIQDNLPI